VTDASGAIIPNAKVTIQNARKGFVRELTTNAVGAFALAPVPLGECSVTVEGAGFQKVVRAGITLTVGQIQRVDAILQDGATSQK